MTLILGNTNPVPALLTSDLDDTLPVNVNVAPVPNLGGSCPGTVVVAANGDLIRYASGSAIPVGGCTIEVDITSGVTGGPYTNLIPAGSLQTDAGVHNAPAVANLFVNLSQPPSISKSFSPTVILRNGVSGMSISLGNGNAVAATLTADLVDVLPAGVRVAADPNIRVSAGCDVSGVEALAGSDRVIYRTGGTIPANGGCAITVDVTADTLGTLVNSIASGDLQTDVGPNQVGTDASLEVLPIPPALNKTFEPQSVAPNAISTLRITLVNPDPRPTSLTVDLTDVFEPADAYVVADIPNVQVTAGCDLASVVATAGGDRITYSVGGTIPASGQCSISVDVIAVLTGGYLNTIGAGALVTTNGVNAAPASARLNVFALSIPVMSYWGMIAMSILLIAIARSGLGRK